MRRRLAQLAEEARPSKDDPLAGKVWFADENTPVSNPTKITAPPGGESPDLAASQQLVASLVDKITNGGAVSEEALFAAKYQREMALATKVPDYTPASARAIAHAAPWTGTESTVDAANRMLQDAHKPLKGSTAGGDMAPKSFKPRPSVSQRLASARDQSLDYEIKHKAAVPSSNEEETTGPTFRELYADRFAGFSALNNNFTAIDSLASQRIEDAIARGEFRDLPGRGKETEKDLHLSSPYIDHTEYYLNNMIKRQGAAPIWIDRQGGLAVRMKQFREQVGRSWVGFVVHKLDDSGGPSDAKLARARQIASSSDSLRQGEVGRWTAEWERKHKEYHAKSVESINSAIRSYNLQAPGAARRGYLTLGKELAAACQTAARTDLEPALRKFLFPAVAPAASAGKGGGAFSGGSTDAAGLFTREAFQQAHTPYAIEEKGVLKGLFKSLWTVQDINGSSGRR